MFNKRVLVAYYSRTGTTREVAHVLAQNVTCDVEEIVDKVNRKGIFGFIGAAYAALRGLPTQIENTKYDASSYDIVIIGTPVWAGHVSCAVRTYLERNARNFKKVAFFSTASSADDDKVFIDMEELCAKKPLSVLRITGKKVKSGEYEKEAKKFIGEIIANQNKG
ncbi:MAG TPA: flavodoxin [Clostridiaceae bacterium]|nr:flavodoxin [Clostridiaceae bacterium]